MSTDSSPVWIGEHRAIGDLETLALVGGNASVDWMCWPRFDSPSVFGRILHGDGGFWSISPVDTTRPAREMYRPNTNALVTRFQEQDGVVEVEDFMAIGEQRCLIRRVGDVL